MRRVVPGPGGCLLWTGKINNRGYGVFWWRGRDIYAHRAAWEMQVGPIPAGLQIDHRCRVRRCVNVDHLEPVTGSVNQRRGHAARSATAASPSSDAG